MILAFPASSVVSGQLALARGGTGADLSASGGSGFFLKQTSAGGVVTVAAIQSSELPSNPALSGNGTITGNFKANTANAASQTLLGVMDTVYAGIWFGSAASSPTYLNYSLLTDGSTIFYNAPTAANFRINDVTKIALTSTAIGFFAAVGSPVAPPSLGAAATDLASVITLANNVRSALINFGLATA